MMTTVDMKNHKISDIQIIPPEVIAAIQTLITVTTKCTPTFYHHEHAGTPGNN